MPLTEADNQRYFDQHKAKEKQSAQWLKRQSKTVRKPIWLAAAAGIGNGIGIIIQAWLLADLLHRVIISKQPLAELVWPIATLLAVFLFRSICTYAQQSFGFEAGAKIRTELRQQLSIQFAKLGPAGLKNQQSGALANVTLEHVEALEPYFSRYLPQQLIVGTLPILMMLVVFPLNWIVGIIFLVTAPLVPLFMALVGMGAASAQRSQFLAMARMGGYFLDRLQGLPTLKLFGQASQEVARINTIAEQFREKTMAVLRIAFLSSAVLEFFSTVAVALVAVYTGLSLLGQIHFGPGQHIDFRAALFVLLLAPEFFLPLKQLAVYYHDRAAALAAAESILAVLALGNRAPPPIQLAQSSDCLLELLNVSKSYGDRRVLTDINLQIHNREKIALIGPSGAGKTTLCQLLLGFEQASAGQILLAGQAISQELATQAIAWSSQQASLFYGSIADNIALGSTIANPADIQAAAQAAGVIEFSQHLPQGLQTLIGEHGFGLSGGQLQRIALARVFFKNADLVILDEPTANLDIATKTTLLDTIDRLFADKTLIIASHDPDVIQRMNRQIKLTQGCLSS